MFILFKIFILYFSFSIQDISSTKRLSPSQQNRNKMRKVNYEKSKVTSQHTDDENQKVNIKQELKTSFRRQMQLFPLQMTWKLKQKLLLQKTLQLIQKSKIL